MFSDVRRHVKQAGKPPGTPTYTGEKSNKEPIITIVVYNETDINERVSNHLEDCLLEIKPNHVTWIDIEGLHDDKLIEKLAKRFTLHPLTVEDILNVEQRPKVEEFDNYIYITIKVLIWDKSASSFEISPLSLIIGKDFVLSLQEQDTTRFDALRTRIKKTANQRLRQQGPDYLAYRITDTVVDDYFVVLEALGDHIEKTEQRVLTNPTQNASTIYRLKRQMLLLRKAIWPMREVVSHLLYVEEKLITNFTRVYLRDVYDHTMQAIDTLETFRDMLSSMLDMYLSGLTIRMNEIMKTLTIITTIFIPITAVAGIYGMNLKKVPLMDSPWGSTIVIASMFLIAIFMIGYFKKKKWF